MKEKTRLHFHRKTFQIKGSCHCKHRAPTNKKKKDEIKGKWKAQIKNHLS
jgi:hypothetical protein